MEISTEKLEYLNILVQSAAFCDVSAEIQIPNQQPEPDKILDCFGTVMMKSKSAEQGKLYVRGIVSFQVLYCSSDNEVYKASAQTDFECSAACDDTNAKYDIAASAFLGSCECVFDTRGNLSCKALVCAEITCYEHKTAEICTDIQGEHIYLKRGEVKTDVLRYYGEKTFSVSDDLTIPGRADEILSSASELEITGYTFTTGKLVAKGRVITELVYLAENETFPRRKKYCSDFSQMVDVDLPEPSAAEITGVMTGVYTELGDDNDSGDTSLLLEVKAVLQCAVFESSSFLSVNDAYSSREKLTLEKETLRLYKPLERESFETRRSFQLDDVIAAAKIITARAMIGKIQIKDRKVYAQCIVTAAYLDTADEINIARCRTELIWECTEIGKAVIKDITVSADDGKINVDIFAQMEICSGGAAEIGNFTSVVCEKINGADERPSLVLVNVHQGDDLWEISKKYCSCKEYIMSINKLESEEIQEKMLLLVPRV